MAKRKPRVQMASAVPFPMDAASMTAPAPKIMPSAPPPMQPNHPRKGMRNNNNLGNIMAAVAKAKTKAGA